MIACAVRRFEIGGVLEWRNHVVMIVGVFRLSPFKFRAGCSCKEFRSEGREGPSRRGVETTKARVQPSLSQSYEVMENAENPNLVGDYRTYRCECHGRY